MIAALINSVLLSQYPFKVTREATNWKSSKQERLYPQFQTENYSIQIGKLLWNGRTIFGFYSPVTLFSNALFKKILDVHAIYMRPSKPKIYYMHIKPKNVFGANFFLNDYWSVMQSYVTFKSIRLVHFICLEIQPPKEAVEAKKGS